MTRIRPSIAVVAVSLGLTIAFTGCGGGGGDGDSEHVSEKRVYFGTLRGTYAAFESYQSGQVSECGESSGVPISIHVSPDGTLTIITTDLTPGTSIAANGSFTAACSWLTLDEVSVTGPYSYGKFTFREGDFVGSGPTTAQVDYSLTFNADTCNGTISAIAVISSDGGRVEMAVEYEFTATRQD